ncbi:MAG: pantoate--beta-alanine ligase [Solirubrobacteraceae bacterium]
MRTLRTIDEMRSALEAPRRRGAMVGLVPTMGAFHDGHLSLMRLARRDCEVVVVSLFVNPTQFNEPQDLVSYPRDETRDAVLAEGVGVDLLFAPAQEEIYPAGFATTVSVSGITRDFEGDARGRTHFDGVATVVSKLLNIVMPDVAYFGEKDAQQVQVIRRLVEDLNMPVRIQAGATVREPDGLAMSSRNAHLSPEERRRAAAIPRALSQAQEMVGAGQQDARVIEQAVRAELESSATQVDYVRIVEPERLAPIRTIAGPARMLVAARFGNTRLIDNQLLRSE